MFFGQRGVEELAKLSAECMVVEDEDEDEDENGNGLPEQGSGSKRFRNAFTSAMISNHSFGHPRMRLDKLPTGSSRQLC